MAIKGGKMGRNGTNGHDDPTGSGGDLSVKAPVFTILLIDGVAKDPGLFAEFLKAQGHFVLRSETLEDSMEKTRKYQPNMILLGCDTEGLSCLKVLPKLLELDPSAAVLMVATHPSIPDTVKAMNLGAVDFLELPLDLTVVKAAIDRQKELFK